MEHFFPQIQMKTKKRFSPKIEHFFSPISSGHLHSDAHPSQIIGGDADVDHTQTIGGDTAKLLVGYIPPSPPGFGTPVQTVSFNIERHAGKLFKLLTPIIIG